MVQIPQGFLDAVVAIGDRSKPDKSDWIATGFLYGRSIPEGPAGAIHPFFVTNRHVVKGRKALRLRFNPSGGAPAREYDSPVTDASGNLLWCGPTDTEVDVAVTPIDLNRLQQEGIPAQVFSDSVHAATKTKMQAEGFSEGDFVYVLGFPFGDVGGDRSYVVARSGCLARVGDTLSGQRRDFLIDVPTFPGNSGGPVVSKPEALSIQGTPVRSRVFLIGITAASLNYAETAVSQQTGRPRVIFEENSGLSAVYPIDFVDDAIARFLAGKREL